jgi:anti-sigma regulatory factor (Ser/Thr protein kinase)
VLPDRPDSVRLARAWLAPHLASLPTHIAADAILLASELVTNAVLHGRPEVCVGARVTRAELRVAVADQEPTMPAAPMRLPVQDQTSGRGLFLVASLATTWGIEPFQPPRGKTIWFTLNIP